MMAECERAFKEWRASRSNLEKLAKDCADAIVIDLPPSFCARDVRDVARDNVLKTLQMLVEGDE